MVQPLPRQNRRMVTLGLHEREKASTLLLLQRSIMEPYLSIIAHTPLFASLDEAELIHMLDCLAARRKTYQAKQFIVRETDLTGDIGVVVSGSVQVITEDAFGNRSITARLTVGEPFGQVYASGNVQASPVSVQAETDCEILFLRFHKIVSPCARACRFHSRVIENMMGVLADRNLMMNRKLAILSQRTIRDKLLAFLVWHSEQANSLEFDIPYNRDELADFLCVNRSALSRELSRMVDEGLLETDRSHFLLHEQAVQ